MMKLKLQGKRPTGVGNAVAVGLASAIVAGQPVNAMEVVAPNSAFATESLPSTVSMGGFDSKSSVDSSLIIPRPEVKDSWSPKDAKRFKELVVKRARRTATKEEQREFSNLQNARRRFENPMSSDEILAERRRNQMLNDLIKFFDKHAIVNNF